MIGFGMALLLVLAISTGVVSGLYAWYFIQLFDRALDKVIKVLKFDLGLLT